LFSSLIAQIHYAYAAFAGLAKGGVAKLIFLSRKIETEQRRSASANLHTIK